MADASNYPSHGTPGHAPEGLAEARAARRVLLGLLAWALVALVTLWAAGPPGLVSEEAPPEEASGARARGVLERLAAGESDAGALLPRPIGSSANDRCRERILEELKRLGLRPEVQEAFGVQPRQKCAGTVRNVVARLRGGRGGPGTPGAILCMAHYDSVGAGPGVGDDLAGVAAWIEVARALRARGILNRDVIFLFEDGEEHGLLGAEVFAAQHPWAADVGAVINMEGRGTSGASRMFETGPGNEWIVKAFRSEARAPSATSLSSEIYKRMPNDTDYTVWRERGVPGLNFAFIGGVTRYHTPLDDLANLSSRSLQHHVTNGMDAILALDGAAFPGEAAFEAGQDEQDAVFFDLAGGSLVLLTARSARLLSVALLIASLLGVVRSIRVGAIRPWRVVLCWLLMLVMLAAGISAAGIPDWIRGMMGLDANASRPAHLAPAAVGVMAAAVVGWAQIVFLTARLARGAEMAAAVLLALSALTSALAWFAPGASFLVALPAAVLAFCSLCLRTRSDVDARWCRSALVALALGAAVLTPVHEGLISAFGLGLPQAVAAPLLLGALLVLPSLMGPGRASAAWIGGVALLLAVLTPVFLSQLDRHTQVKPGHLNLVHVMEEDRAAWQMNSWRSRPESGVLTALAAKLELGEASESKAPVSRIWTGKRVASKAAPLVSEAPPRVEILGGAEDASGGLASVSFRAIPGRRCHQMGISIPNAASLVVGGVTIPGSMAMLLAPAEEGVEITVHYPDGISAGLEADMISQRFGLRGVRGRMVDDYLSARPAEYVPFGHGDGSAIRAKCELVEPREGSGGEESEDGASAGGEGGVNR